MSSKVKEKKDRAIVVDPTFVLAKPAKEPPPPPRALTMEERYPPPKGYKCVRLPAGVMRRIHVNRESIEFAKANKAIVSFVVVRPSDKTEFDTKDLCLNVFIEGPSQFKQAIAQPQVLEQYIGCGTYAHAGEVHTYIETDAEIICHKLI